MKIIVGLGNPGLKYQGTRHNVGFEVVEAFVAACGWHFSREATLFSQVAKGELQGQPCLAVLPMTFMNESGRAVRRCLDYYRVPVSEVLVVSDEVALPVGAMRLRAQGSAGGHNGLKSIQAYLGTTYYARLRIGVGRGEERDLSDHVLGHFPADEKKEINEVIKRGVDVLALYVTQGIAAALQKANKREL